MKKTFFAFLSTALLALATLTVQAQTTKTDTTQAINPVGVDKEIPAATHYEGGQAAMYDFIAKNLNYPPLAKRNRIQGQCIIGFTLNDDGSVSGMRVLKNVGGGCGEEALRVARLLKFNAPGYSIKTSLPINFKL